MRRAMLYERRIVFVPERVYFFFFFYKSRRRFRAWNGGGQFVLFCWLGGGVGRCWQLKIVLVDSLLCHLYRSDHLLCEIEFFFLLSEHFIGGGGGGAVGGYRPLLRFTGCSIRSFLLSSPISSAQLGLPQPWTLFFWFLGGGGFPFSPPPLDIQTFRKPTFAVL